MDRRVDVRHFVHRSSCDISSSNMAAYERWPRVNGRGTKYSSEVCRMVASLTRAASYSRVAQGFIQAGVREGGGLRPPHLAVGGYPPLIFKTLVKILKIPTECRKLIAKIQNFPSAVCLERT